VFQDQHDLVVSSGHNVQGKRGVAQSFGILMFPPKFYLDITVGARAKDYDKIAKVRDCISLCYCAKSY
jgi:hypothetical protein